MQVILDTYANNPGPNVNEVWLKAGNYSPTSFVGTSTAARDKSFWVKGNIKIYGGFNGTETELSQRNIVNNPTLLNGVGAYHTMIVTNTNAASYTLIDGVTITGGNANGSSANSVGSISFERNFGGGVLCYQNAPTFNNVIFKTNSAEYGGGVFNQGGSPKYNNCVFTENTSSSYGGAIENFENSTPVFNNCVIGNNSAFRGGAAANNGGSATYTNCTIVKNSATVDTASGAFIELNNTTSNYKNCIIWGNTANDFITNAGSTSNVSYSVTQSTITGTSNLYTNPQLVNINDGDGADNKWFTSDDGFKITQVSNCGSTGDNSAIPSYITGDILNNSRILQVTVDRGAYEVDGANASDLALAQIGNEGDSPNTVASEITTTQLGQIVPVITSILTANQAAYQIYIDANPSLFSSPATAAEVQAMITAVNAQVAAQVASNAVLTQIGNEANEPIDSPLVPSIVTTTQLGQILPSITGIVAANEVAYQVYIDANSSLFSSPATAAEVQAMINTVNAQVAAQAASNAVLVQIGNEGDAPNTVSSVVTVVQLGIILPAITGIEATNESAYQDYIDANPEMFSAPATAAEVQAMIDTVNAQVAAVVASDAVLTQIGDEGDSPNAVSSTVTTAQLETIIPEITEIVTANEAAYQAYIDANPSLFSSPATATEVQVMVNAVNTALAVNVFDMDSVLIYPNPSNAIFNIKINTNATIQLFDAMGKTVKLDKITIGTSSLDLSNYSDGIYLIKITNEINQTKTVRLIKR